MKFKVGSFYMDMDIAIYLVIAKHPRKGYLLWFLDSQKQHCGFINSNYFLVPELEGSLPVEIEPHEIQRFIKWT